MRNQSKKVHLFHMMTCLFLAFSLMASPSHGGINGYDTFNQALTGRSYANNYASIRDLIPPNPGASSSSAVAEQSSLAHQVSSSASEDGISPLGKEFQIKIIDQALSQAKRTERLELAGKGLTDEGVQYLVRRVNQLGTRYLSIDLARNHIGDAGAKELASWFQKLPTWWLYLDQNEIAHDGIKALVKAIIPALKKYAEEKHQTDLSSITLGENKLSIDSIKEIIEQAASGEYISFPYEYDAESLYKQEISFLVRCICNVR